MAQIEGDLTQPFVAAKSWPHTRNEQEFKAERRWVAETGVENQVGISVGGYESTDQRTDLASGAFVLVASEPLGRGKIVECFDGQALVAWFDNPAVDVCHEAMVSLDEIKVAPLQHQQRVYHHDTDAGTWHVGRVDDAGRVDGRHHGIDEPLYWIAFPNRRLIRVRRSELYVRWDRPIRDPAGLLAAHATETPFWHGGRSQLLHALTAQRACTGGLTGLFSASVELEGHQYRVVHTILNDPIQRYLLADEVGLGKTIEAGAILRQFLLENREAAEAVVIVPPHLRAQWVTELQSRFHLGEALGRQVRVISMQDLESVSGAPGMLIVDEAHHPAALARSPMTAARARYAMLARLAAQTPRLLLLSATPVLRNEDGFLAMLHLLDPAAYPLEDREGFRRRVTRRQQIAELVADLGDDSPPMFVEDSLNTLEELLGDDPLLLDLVAAVRPLTDEDSTDPQRQVVLSALRTHVGEIYRLHRRLLRNRRSGLQDILRGRDGAQCLPCPAGAAADVHRALEEWRGDALVAALEPERAAAARGLWSLLLHAALSHPDALLALVEARLGSAVPDAALWPCDPDTTALLAHPPLSEHENGWLRDLVAALRAEADPRADALIEWLRATQSGAVLVFVDRPAVADALATQVKRALGGRVRRHREQADLEAFLQEGPVDILICDHEAEEGLNLQRSAARILHYDLPLSPNRIEQRVGRIDRMGARGPARSLFFEAGQPYVRAWQQCLDEDIRVFSRSIASLQYVLDGHLTRLLEDTFTNGIDAFDQLRAALRSEEDGLDAELRRIRHQENLDALEADPRIMEQFEAMEDLDFEEERLERELDSWLVNRLHVWRMGDGASENDRRLRCRYGYSRDRRATLMPIEDWCRWFGRRLGEDATEQPLMTPVMTWSRNQAWRESLPPIRLGNALFDGAWEHARHDDRGVAFCMWRHRADRGREAPLLAFRFDFLIESGTDELETWLAARPHVSGAAVRRRLDGLLQPTFRTVFVSEHIEPIDDPALVEVLRQPYRSARGPTGRDINLRLDRWMSVQEDVFTGDWSRLVRDAERCATTAVTMRSDLGRLCDVATSRLAAEQTRHEAQRDARLSRLQGPAADAERAARLVDRELHALMARALARPRVRPDAVGAIVLAAYDPFEGSERG